MYDVSMATGEEANDGFAVPVRRLDSQGHVAGVGSPSSMCVLQTLPHNLKILRGNINFLAYA